MPRLDRDERAARRRADAAAGAQLGLDDGAVLSDLDRASDDLDVAAGRRRAAQLDLVLRGDGARRCRGATFAHEVVRRRPLRVAVHERADDPARVRAVVSLVELLGAPARDDAPVIPRDALHMEAALVAGTAAETCAV